VIALLLLLILGGDAPATIHIRVEGGAAAVVAYREGVAVASAPVVDGVAVIAGVPEGEYDLVAVGPDVISLPERGVRDEARLMARPAFPLEVEAPAGTQLVWEGLTFGPGELQLPEGIHRIVATHPERVPSEGALVRVAGPTRLRIDLDPGLVVTGVVRGPDEVPIDGAAIEVFADGRPTGRKACSGPDGRFGIGGFRGNVVSLRVRAIGYAETLRRIDFLPGEERARCEIALVPGSSVTVTVRGGGGRAEALLLPEWLERTLGERRVQANVRADRREGGDRFRFSGLLPRMRYRILVSAPGCLPEAVPTFIAPDAGGCTDYDVGLQRGASIAGKTVPGAIVLCADRDGRLLRRRADRHGDYRFDGLHDGTYRLTLSDLDAVGATIHVTPGSATDCPLPTPPVAETTTLQGTVTDADGRPLPGVEVRCGNSEARSDSAGAFALRGLARGGRQFTVALTPLPGCRAFHDDPHLPFIEFEARPPQRVAVRLSRAGTLRLRLDTAGRPLARATLFLSALGSGLRREVAIPRGGDLLEVRDLPTGGYLAEVGAPGFAGTGGAKVTARALPGEPETLRIIRGRSLSGRVLLREGRLGPLGTPLFADTPLDRATVRLVSGDPRDALAATSVDPDGGFFLAGLPAAPLHLCVFAPGLPATLFSFDLTRSDLDGVDLPLQRAVAATLRVTGAQGVPVAGVRATLLTEGGIDVQALAATCRFGGWVGDAEEIGDFLRTFADPGGDGGGLLVPFLAPGSYRFRVTAPGHEPAEIGVRAYTAWQIDQIRALPLEGVPLDLEPYLRLKRAPLPKG